MARARQQGRQRKRRLKPRLRAAQIGSRLSPGILRRTHQQNGRLELLQLFYRNRGIFLEETRGASAGVAAGLGDHGGVAEEQMEAAAGSAPKTVRAAAGETFSREELKTYFAKNTAQLKRAAEKGPARLPEMPGRLIEIAESLESSALLLDTPGALDLDDLERRLTILDEKIHALLMSHAAEELMLKIRREVDGQLAMYRRKMKTEQLAMVEKQYMQKRLLEEFGLPRLSLFYLS